MLTKITELMLLNFTKSDKLWRVQRLLFQRHLVHVLERVFQAHLFPVENVMDVLRDRLADLGKEIAPLLM
jgi:hypothetical protein